MDRRALRAGPSHRISPRGLRCGVFTAGLTALTISCSGSGECAAVDVERTWARYEAGAVEEAHRDFSRAVEACPASGRAKLGLAYTSLRRGDLAVAEAMFEVAVDQLPDEAEGLLGLGILRWRRGDFREARGALERALEIDPENQLARAYLQRFPPESAPAERPAFQRPETLQYPSRVRGSRFEVRRGGAWEPFFVKGVNIGAAIPGLHPSQFPDSATYASWLGLIGTMGANAIRVYTIHPPGFYGALLDYNQRNPEAPLWLFHGVWAELPPGDVDYDHPGWRSGFFREIHSVIDVIHGRADLPLRSGRAAGSYSADVSPWTAGLILGREWEAHSVAGYNEATVGQTAWRGEYVSVEDGTPIDVWMARAIEEAVSYETAAYNAQRPVAYTNWPPTDPMRHPTESTSLEERAIRRAFGDSTVYAEEILTGDDVVSLDPTLIRTTAAFVPGYFASYHVYPYYPDFMVLEPALRRTSPWGESNFWGYLLRLREHHGELPVLIAEYGLPASIGNAHLQPQGWHHGGNTERKQAAVNVQLTREIEASGMAGGIVFEWIDEWFKDTWNTTGLEVPRETDRLWYNRMDAEEHYGMLAVEPAPVLSGSTLEERLASWERVTPLYRAGGGVTLRAVTDEAYVWLLVEYGDGSEAVEETLVGFDVIDSSAGDFRWPQAVGSRLPVGLEFVLHATPESAWLTVDPSYNPVSLDTLDFVPPAQPTDWPPIEAPPPGMFRGRFVQEVPGILQPRPNEDGEYERLLVLTNRARFGRDSTEYGALGYDWGILPEGEPPDGLWRRNGEVLEIRIPWQLLNISDPSHRRALRYDRLGENETRGTETIQGIRLLFGFRSGSEIRYWPTLEEGAGLPLLSWSTWRTPRWTTRLRPTYWLLREVWSGMEPRSDIVEE